MVSNGRSRKILSSAIAASLALCDVFGSLTEAAFVRPSESQAVHTAGSTEIEFDTEQGAGMFRQFHDVTTHGIVAADAEQNALGGRIEWTLIGTPAVFTSTFEQDGTMIHVRLDFGPHGSLWYDVPLSGGVPTTVLENLDLAVLRTDPLFLAMMESANQLRWTGADPNIILARMLYTTTLSGPAEMAGLSLLSSRPSDGCAIVGRDRETCLDCCDEQGAATMALCGFIGIGFPFVAAVCAAAAAIWYFGCKRFCKGKFPEPKATPSMETGGSGGGVEL